MIIYPLRDHEFIYSFFNPAKSQITTAPAYFFHLSWFNEFVLACADTSSLAQQRRLRHGFTHEFTNLGRNVVAGCALLG